MTDRDILEEIITVKFPHGFLIENANLTHNFKVNKICILD